MRKGDVSEMSKIDEVRKAMVTAMKEGNKERKDSLSMLLSALKNKAIDKRADLTEAEENEVVLKEIKQNRYYGRMQKPHCRIRRIRTENAQRGGDPGSDPGRAR